LAQTLLQYLKPSIIMKISTYRGLALAMMSIYLLVPNCVSAQLWVPTGSQDKLWNSIACSADGSKIVAVGEFGQIHVSTNSGLTWVSNTIPNSNFNWNTGATSADGSRMAVAAGTGELYLSTNSGTTWFSNYIPTIAGISHAWKSIGCSADGYKIVAVAGGGGIVVSTNGGQLWLQTNIPQSWVSVACSADGNKMILAADIGGIYTSTNSGTGWISNQVSSSVWNAVACSADGNTLEAVEWQGKVYVAPHSTVTWTPTIAPDGLLWHSLACSANASVIVAAAGDNNSTGSIYISTNSGTAWNLSYPGNYHWTSVASSADGFKIYAARYGGGIYTLQNTSSPQLHLIPLPGSVALSWIIPSANFALQRSSDLISWADATDAPVLNLTILQNQVTMPLSNAGSFYRLKAP
jgi:photosystem II stability/assembly factor-like uncharacterized protein